MEAQGPGSRRVNWGIQGRHTVFGTYKVLWGLGLRFTRGIYKVGKVKVEHSSNNCPQSHSFIQFRVQVGVIYLGGVVWAHAGYVGLHGSGLKVNLKGHGPSDRNQHPKLLMVRLIQSILEQVQLPNLRPIWYCK